MEPDANFGESCHDEARRIFLSRTPVDNERLGSDVQNTMSSEVRFRVLLAEGDTERLELTTV
jgi:hypothetical protein